MDKFVDNYLAKSLQLAHSEGRRHDMSGIKDQLKVWDLEREASRHLFRADHYAQKGMLAAANAEYKRAELVLARRDQLGQETSP